MQFRKKDHLLQAGTGIFYWSERLSPGASSEKCTRGKLERYSMDYEKQSDRRNMGRPEQFYGETIHQPAFRIEIPVTGKNREEEKKEIQEIMMIPLECIYSLTQQ